MKILGEIFLLLLVITVLGCAKMEIGTEYDPSVDFTSFSTYAWLPNTQEHLGTIHIDKEAFESRLRPLVAQELGNKKYLPDTSGKPDLLLRYQLTVKKEVEVSDSRDAQYSNIRGDNRNRLYSGGGRHSISNIYDKGTLILDFVDPESKELIWRGTAAAQVHLYENNEEEGEKLARAVKLIFKHFPPQ